MLDSIECTGILKDVIPEARATRYEYVGGDFFHPVTIDEESDIVGDKAYYLKKFCGKKPAPLEV